MKFLLMILAMNLAAAPKQTQVVHIVTMDAMSFNPKVIEIKPGDKVRWVNESYSSHNVIANNGSFKSAMLETKGQAFEFTFTQTGTYAYFCRPHKLMGMKGKVIVKE